MVRTTAAVVFLPVLLAVHAASARAKPPLLPAACKGRFEQAREELIRRGFAPTTDRDTPRWLQVDDSAEYPEFGLSLKLEMRSSADGPATFYWLNVNRAGRKRAERGEWRHHKGRFCCDEHAAPEDDLYEYRWERVAGARRAIVSVVQFRDLVRDPRVQQSRALFAEVARKAADDCLRAAQRM